MVGQAFRWQTPSITAVYLEMKNTGKSRKNPSILKCFPGLYIFIYSYLRQTPQSSHLRYKRGATNLMPGVPSLIFISFLFWESGVLPLVQLNHLFTGPWCWCLIFRHAEPLDDDVILCGCGGEVCRLPAGPPGSVAHKTSPAAIFPTPPQHCWCARKVATAMQ